MNMPDEIDSEIQAIKTLLAALEPLKPSVRQSVLDYVMKRLGIEQKEFRTRPESQVLPPGEPLKQSKTEIRIQDLVSEKKPRNAVEMATLVAYYLSHRAPEGVRKSTISTKDIETYFKIGDFKLPTQPRFTLPNAKAAGYLDAVGEGAYKLNPVGYNLVVHSMPKTGATPTSRPRRQRGVSKNQKAKRQK
jgi:hypothetical protein